MVSALSLHLNRRAHQTSENPPLCLCKKVRSREQIRLAEQTPRHNFTAPQQGQMSHDIRGGYWSYMRAEGVRMQATNVYKIGSRAKPWCRA